MVNPFSWIQSGERAVGSLSEGQYGDAALNALGALPALGFADDVGRALSKGRNATTRTPLKNAWKLNTPKKLMRSAEIPKVSSLDDVVDLYRVQERNAKTFQQLADEGKLNKAFNNPQTLARKAEEEKYFGQWFTNNKKDLDFYIADREFLDPEIINLKIPRSELSKYSNYDKTLSRAPDREFVIPLSEQQKYINTPKNSFKSEIDWGKWNADTPKYPELMNEYNAIEESTKKAGTWMKNPDGSPFIGSNPTKEELLQHGVDMTPEEAIKAQFIQQQSSFLKNYIKDSKLINPDGSPTIQYHGSAKKFDTFDESKFQLGDAGYSGSGIYTTPSKISANSYARSSAGFHSGKIDPTVYHLYGQANNPISSEQLIKEGDLDLFNFHRKSAPVDQQLLNYDAAIHNQLRNVERIRSWNDAFEVVFPTNKQLKSAVGNVGFFDANSNIYKAVAPVGVGLGVGASQLQEKKYGGWLDSYQDGGETLPQLNSKMDVANFYKNPLSEKYGIAQNPDSGSFEYYLKSGQSSNPIKQEVEELESQNLRKAYVPSLSEEVSRMSDVVLPEVKQQQSRSRNIEKTYELERQKDFIDSQLYNQPIGPQLDPTSLPIPSYSGMNPIQEYYANLLYDQYGKFVVTDKGENKTFYGTKTKDGDWDVNSFEVLTGRASDPRYQQVLKEELAQRRNDKYGITPIGVFPLSKKPNYYGSPGFKAEGSSLNPKVTVAYHTVFNPEKRLSLFENEDLADNYASSGCINCKKPNLEALINFVGQNGLSATIDSRLPLDKNIEWTKKNTPKYKKWLDNYK
jgi:hypothetical protein